MFVDFTHRERLGTRASRRQCACRSAAAALCIASLICLPLRATAHAFWLVPNLPTASPGDEVAFDLRIGPTWPGERTARLSGMVASFEVRDGSGTRPVQGRDEAVPVGHVRMGQPGAAVVTMRTNASELQLSGGEFEQYLSEEGLDGILAMRHRLGLQATPGRESFSRCAKVLVFVGGSSAGYDRVSGMTLELVPMTDPLTYRTGSTFSLRLLLRGQPLAGALVQAWPKSNVQAGQKVRTDAHGDVTFELPVNGPWMFSAVNMEPVLGATADWESIWASLSMSLPRQ